MAENRKLFYAISVLLLLSCCQIITMFPHNSDSGMGNYYNKNSSSTGSDTGISSSADTSNDSEYNRANVDTSNSNQSYGNNDDDSELIIAVERRHHQEKLQQQTMEKPNDGGLSTGNMGVWEASDSVASENVDDLIFLDKRPINQHQHQQEQPAQPVQHEYVAQLPPRPPKEHHHHQRHEHFEIHHHLSADGIDSDNDSSSSTSDEHSDSLTHPTLASSPSYVAAPAKDHDADADMTVGEALEPEPETDADAALPPHEIQLQTDNDDEEVSGASTVAVTPLDLSDFLSLIPAARVKAIVAHYYHDDPEVQRAHAFMSSRDFISLEHHIITIPEMSAFLRYLNSSGLDLVNFVTTLTNMTAVVSASPPTEKGQVDVNVGGSAFETNDIEYGQKQSEATTAAAAAPANVEIQTQAPSSSAPVTATAAAATASTSATIDMETTTIKEQLNGLHGLVDSILDVLPQDQILATFFDKLESSEQFSKLVDNIGSPEFSKILNNMQSSVPLRNLIFTLHNNGIYVIRIVDSLKSYFFLGGF